MNYLDRIGALGADLFRNQRRIASAPSTVCGPALDDRPPARGRGRKASDRVRDAPVTGVGLLKELGTCLFPFHRRKSIGSEFKIWKSSTKFLSLHFWQRGASWSCSDDNNSICVALICAKNIFFDEHENYFSFTAEQNRKKCAESLLTLTFFNDVSRQKWFLLKNAFSSFLMQRNQLSVLPS